MEQTGPTDQSGPIEDSGQPGPGEQPRRLVLVRHAKTEQVPGKPDHERELLPRGEGDARAAGAWLVEHGVVPHLVLCSTSTRTQQTWQQMAEAGALGDVEVWSERAIYNAHPEEILHVVQEVPEPVRTLLVLGHAPGIPSLAAGLADPELSDSAALDELEGGLPTGAGAVLEVTGDWADLAPERARLVSVHTWRRPKEEQT